MNPMTNVKNIIKLSEQELRIGGKSSWHDQYKDSAWVFTGGLPYSLTEGDVICVFSQYGEIVNINLVRDKETGKQKGYCFVCYEDQRSTILAVDNLNGMKILGRTIRVDHVSNYEAPKEGKKHPLDEETRLLRNEGCAPLSVITQNVGNGNVKQEQQGPSETVAGGVRLPPRLPIRTTSSEDSKEKLKKKEKAKKLKKERKKKKKRKKSSSSSSDSDSSSSDSESSDSSHSERKSKKKKKKRKK